MGITKKQLGILYEALNKADPHNALLLKSASDSEMRIKPELGMLGIQYHGLQLKVGGFC